MQAIRQSSPSTLTATVDTELFSDHVLAKVLYWWSGEFVVECTKEGKDITVSREKKEGVFSPEQTTHLRQRFAQDLIDFKTREIVDQQTRTVRQLLMVKAFSATDEFDGIPTLE